VITDSNQPFRVLVVDDDTSIRETYRQILCPESSGLGALEALISGAPARVEKTVFDVAEAAQGETALALHKQALAEGRPHQIAFIDMRMPPGWDGLQTAVALRAVDPAIYIIIATAFSDYDVNQLQEALGHDVVMLRKPFTREEVFQIARTLCQSRLTRDRLEYLTADMEHQVQERTAELNQRVARQLVLAEVATHCIELDMTDQPDDAVHWSLARLGHATGADAASIFHLDPGGVSFSMTHEWLALGMTSLRDRFQAVQERDYLQTFSRLRRGESFRLSCLDELRDDSPDALFDLRLRMSGQIESLLCVPVDSGGRLIGFINIGCRRAGANWDEHDESLLRTAGNILFRTLDALESKRLLSENEARYSSLVQSIPGMVYRCRLDADWTIQFMSDYILELSGYPVSDFIDSRVRSYASVIHPDDRALVDQAVRAGVARHAPYSMEYRIVHADGGIRWVNERGQAVFDRDGNVSWLDGVITDITTRKRMELTLAATAEFVSGASHDDFVEALVRHAAENLNLDYVHVALLRPDKAGVRTLAAWLDGKPIPNWSYDLGNTPCRYVMQIERQCIESGVQAAYPLDEYLHVMGAEAYVGEPLIDREGKAFGLIVGVNRKPLLDAEMVQANLRILAARAAAECAQRETMRSLRLERDTTRNILHTADALIVALDTLGRITLINRMGCELLGYSEAELIGQDWFTFCLPANPRVEEVRAVFRKALANDLAGSEYFENPVRTRSGEERLIAWHNSSIRDAEGNIIGGLSAGEDITERRKAETALHVALIKYKTLFDCFPLGITVTDPAGQVLESNAAAERLLGVPREIHEQRQIDSPEWRIVRADGTPMPAAEYASMRALHERQRVENVEMGIVKQTGETIWLSVTADLLPIEGYGLVITYGDITARRLAEEQIRQLAYFDPLTSLPNRRLLMDRLGQALNASKRSQEFGAVLMLDMDYFKGLNDSRGHDVGDQLLIEVARRLLGQVRQEDTVSRLGGDEYVLILQGLGDEPIEARAQAARVADKIRHALGEPYGLAGCETPYSCSASIGVTLFHSHRETVETLLKQADIALYRAKDAGRNRVGFYQSDMPGAE
jgi:diguanylate cyclase (GGDEF)-like protein/PAS domain S-box-containing protein